jgi:hypothetical protein
VIFKIFTRTCSETGAPLSSQNCQQRGVRGIHCGFPNNQAGYLIWVPQISQFVVAFDVAFDENFASPLVYDYRLFRNALPLRSTGNNDLVDPTRIPSHTGGPYVSFISSDDWPTDELVHSPFAPVSVPEDYPDPSSLSSISESLDFLSPPEDDDAEQLDDEDDADLVPPDDFAFGSQPSLYPPKTIPQLLNQL